MPLLFWANILTHQLLKLPSYLLLLLSWRMACNDIPPDDIFYSLYGFGCGDANFTERCLKKDGAGTGACKYGYKNRNYLFDTYKVGSNVIELRSFRRWFLSAMTQAYYLHHVSSNKTLLACARPGTSDLISIYDRCACLPMPIVVRAKMTLFLPKIARKCPRHFWKLRGTLRRTRIVSALAKTFAWKTFALPPMDCCEVEMSRL